MKNDRYRIERQKIPAETVENALRTINVELVLGGLSVREVNYWNGTACWFPHLRDHPCILKLRSHIEAFGEPCDPQILLQFPHPPDYVAPEITFHVDQPPTYARERRYSQIAGVPLTRWDDRTGGIRFWDSIDAPILEPGDMVLFGPDTPHSAGINRSGEIRYAVYFRWLRT